MRRLLRDTLVAVVGGLAAALVASIRNAHPNVILAAGIGICVLVLVSLEVTALNFLDLCLLMSGSLAVGDKLAAG